MSPSNFWLKPPETGPKQDHSDDYLTVTEHNIASAAKGWSEPLTDRDWLPSQLGELLFGQNDDSAERLRTFLLVDPTLRRDVRGVFDLDDDLDVPARCLFQGDAAETLKESAPYIVDLSQSAPDGKVSRFHSDFFRHHWGKGTGIIIRSQASMDDLWRHFRKFTRLLVAEDCRWVFFVSGIRASRSPTSLASATGLTGLHGFSILDVAVSTFRCSSNLAVVPSAHRSSRTTG